MPAHVDEVHRSATASAEDMVDPNGSDAAEALKHGPRGAFLIAGIAVGLLFVGWLAFYFFLFLPRGSVG